MRIAGAAWLALALFLVGLSVGRAADRDETIVTVQVTSADHELAEGYFALGDSASVMARSDTDLYRFLARQRGRQVKILLTQAGADLSKLER